MPRHNPPPSLAKLLPRGVSLAPWLGPEDEVVVVAMTSCGRKFAEVVVPWGVDRMELMAELRAQLDVVDPPQVKRLRLA